jgi:hypothetical protein
MPHMAGSFDYTVMHTTGSFCNVCMSEWIAALLSEEADRADVVRAPVIVDATGAASQMPRDAGCCDFRLKPMTFIIKFSLRIDS